MKSTILVVLTAVISGFIGWILNTTQPNTLGVASEKISRIVTQKAAGMELVSIKKPKETSLGHNGDILFREMVHSTLWVRTQKTDGSIGSKHAFVQAVENPPLSGKFEMVYYVVFDRPDLRELLRENAKRTSNVLNVVSSIEVHQEGTQRVPVLRVFFSDASRVLNLKESDFPSTSEEMWRLVEPRLRSTEFVVVR